MPTRPACGRTIHVSLRLKGGFMTRPKLLFVGMLLLTLLVGPASATAAKSYKLTGKVLQATSDLIVVQKGKKTYEFARDSNTKVTGELKVGSEVTIHYRKVAFSVDVIAPKSSDKPKS